MLNIYVPIKQLLVFIAASALSLSVSAQSQKLHIYNWSDYIAPDTIANFSQQTQINVSYDAFDSNAVLESKLMAGHTGFDLVVPTDSFLARQLHAKIYQPLDKSLLPNYHHLDPVLLKMMQIHDPGNQYSIPYMWQSTGIGYNIDKVTAILGDNMPLDSWDLVFDVDNLTKLSECGVAFLDAPSEIFPTVLNYLGKDPNSHKSRDYHLAAELLKKLRPYVTYFHSSKYINDLSGGDICVAIGWSGDVMQAKAAADEVDRGVNIGYIVPKEGAIITFDVFAIPRDAKNVSEAYQFLNYLLEPEVIANISNYVFYPSANKDALTHLDKSIAENPSIYPPPEVMSRLFAIEEQSPQVDRQMVRLWTSVLTGQ